LAQVEVVHVGARAMVRQQVAVAQAKAPTRDKDRVIAELEEKLAVAQSTGAPRGSGVVSVLLWVVLAGAWLAVAARVFAPDSAPVCPATGAESAESATPPTSSAVAAVRLRKPLAYPRFKELQLFTPQECKRIKKLAKKLQFVDAAVGSGALAGGTSSKGVSKDRGSRVARLAAIPKNDPDFRMVYDRILKAVQQLNNESWRFVLPQSVDSDNTEYIQYSHYPGKDHGFYTWHEDVGYKTSTASRLLSVSVQLSNPDTYTGGELSLRDGGRVVNASRTQGIVIVFPSHVSHTVNPVLSGDRHSLVQWYQLDAQEGEAADAAPTPPATPPAAQGCEMSVTLPDGNEFPLKVQEGESAKDAARRFALDHGIASRHLDQAIKQISSAIQSRCPGVA